MVYALAIVAGIFGAAVGWLVTSVAALWIAGLCGMSDFEGGRAMFAFLAVGPVGGLIAMVASAWLVLRAGIGRVPLAPAVGRLAIVLIGIALLVTAGVVIRLATLDTYTDTAPPELQFEISLPAGMPTPDLSTLRVELHTDENVGQSQLADSWADADGGRRVIFGSVPLAVKTSARLLVVSWPDQPTRLFTLPLSRDPASTAVLSAWRRADHIDAGGPEQPRPAPADDPIEIRYRIQRAGEE